MEELIGLIKEIDPDDEYFYIETENNKKYLVKSINCTTYCWNNKYINARVIFEIGKYGNDHCADNCHLEEEQLDEKSGEESIEGRSDDESNCIQMEDLIREKNITMLFHFTKISNLKSIFENGIVPRYAIDEGCVCGEVNDKKRLDDCKDATCLSISFPNYKLLYRFSQGQQSDWAIIELSPFILLEKPCAFTWWNAASKLARPAKEKIGIKFFKLLFEDMEGFPSRDKLGIPDCYPTNPQAEALVFDVIEQSYIKKIYVKDHEGWLKAATQIGKHYETVEIDTSFFKPRKDYYQW